MPSGIKTFTEYRLKQCVDFIIATLLAQHNHVVAVDIISEKVGMINNRKSPIQVEYVEKYLAEKELDLAWHCWRIRSSLVRTAMPETASFIYSFCCASILISSLYMLCTVRSIA